MPAVTIRNLPEEIHRALKRRAADHGRSTEAEIRTILEEAVRPQEGVRIGSALAEFGQRIGGIDLEVEPDRTPTEAAKFGCSCRTPMWCRNLCGPMAASW